MPIPALPQSEQEPGPPPEMSLFPHDFPDRAFKELMSDLSNLQDLTEVVVPECAECLDCLNATIVPTEIIVSEVPDWPKGISDIIYDIPVRAQLRESFPLGVHVVEHQSMPAEDVVFRAFWIIAARWKRRSQDWDRNQRPGPFRLPSGTGIIIYTGSVPWNGPRTISGLIQATPPLVNKSPRWEPDFLEIRRHAPEQLLKMEQRLFQSLAVVRGQNEPADIFGSIFADTFSRLASLRKQDQGRWIGLARFVMSWGLAKRRPAEHERLRSITRKVYRSQQAQQEIQQMMDTIIGAEFMKGVQQGLTQGEARGETRGRLAARREDLIGLLNGKFAEHVNESVVQRIEAASDLNVLKQWVEAAGISKSWKQFLKAVDWTPLP